jgi:hypothetical protein
MLFVPQAITAIISSLFGPTLARSLGAKNVFLAGMLSNLLSMGLLIASQFLMADRTAAYAVLLLATTCIGLAFGLAVPVINTCAAAFFPLATGMELPTYYPYSRKPSSGDYVQALAGGNGSVLLLSWQ